MTDDKQLDEIIASLDPVAADPAPPAGSGRFHSILERAMTTDTDLPVPNSDEHGDDPAPGSPDPARTTDRRAGDARRAPLGVTLGAVAAVAVLLAGAVVVLRGGESGDLAPATGGESATAADPATAERPQDPAPRSEDGQTSLAEALDATRSAPSMAVGIVRVVDTENGPAASLTDVWHYSAPDRWEALIPTESAITDEHPPAGTSARLFIGGRTWAAVDGRWVEESRPNARTPFPASLLDDFFVARADCQFDVDGQLVAWASSEAPCAPEDATEVGPLPVGTALAVVELDHDGRLHKVVTATVLDLGPDVRTEGSDQLVNRLGGAAETTAYFWYENVPEVSMPPES